MKIAIKLETIMTLLRCNKQFFNTSVKRENSILLDNIHHYTYLNTLWKKSYPLHQGLPAGFPSSDRSILMIVTFNVKVYDGGWQGFYDSPALLQRGEIREHGERRRMKKWFIAAVRAFTQTMLTSRQWNTQFMEPKLPQVRKVCGSLHWSRGEKNSEKKC